ncbi:1-methylthio-D-xylulose 5-phosphate methylsulfurylase [Candidatus Entotheonellaceae bacterium PAL068K]
MKSRVQYQGDFRWAGIYRLAYKPEDRSHFDRISRQTLFAGLADFDCDLRYFDLKPDGYSTFERHQYVHCVVIIRGPGQCVVGQTISDLEPFDIINIPAMTWRQFRANRDDHLGFLCWVKYDRDRPSRPTETQLQEIRANPYVAQFMRI